MSAHVPNARIDAVVGDRRESAVARRGERREDVDAAEQPVQRTMEQAAQIRQSAAEPVRIGQELRSGHRGGVAAHGGASAIDR